MKLRNKAGSRQLPAGGKNYEVAISKLADF